MNSIYLDIFIEHLKSIFLIPIGKDVTLSTMRFLQPEGQFAVEHLVAIAAILLGASLNWWLGSFFSRYRTAFHGISENDYMFFSNIVQKYGFWLVALWWLPVGTVLPFITGFFRVKWKIVSLLMIVGYGLQLLFET